MAVSGSTNFELDVAEYVEEAFERCGLEVRTGWDLTSARRSLNLLFADWANRGLNRWTIQQVTLPLATGVSIYPASQLTLSVATVNAFQVAETLTGVTSGAKCVILSAISSSEFSISEPTNGTFSVGETIAGATSGASTTVSAVVSLSPAQSTIDILSAVVRTGANAGQTDIAISRISRDAYINISSKNSSSRPTQFYVDRLITPSIKLWPTPDNNSYTLVYDKLTRIDDVDNPQNTVDIPFRFYPCLSAGLAYYISLKRAPERTQLLKAVYEEEFERAAAEDRDRASLSLTPSRDYYSFIR